jgi:predicted ABC-type ATPase
MDIEDSQKPYLLDPKLHDSIYQDIMEHTFAGLEKPPTLDNRQAIYLAAQPGSGKTTLRNYLMYEMGISNNTVVLNADELREYHPDYHALQSDTINYAKAPYLVNPDANGWYNKLQAEASSKGYNLIFDSTLGGNANDYATSMRKRISEGYKLSLHVLAINSELSRLGIYLRYETQMLNKGNGRFVSMKAHDINYNNLVPNLSFLLDEIPWEKVGVYSRHVKEKDGIITNNAVKSLYSYTAPIDRSKIISVIMDERQKVWTEIERNYLKFRIDQVESQIKQRGGELGSFRNDLQNLIKLLDNSHH